MSIKKISSATGSNYNQESELNLVKFLVELYMYQRHIKTDFHGNNILIKIII